MMSSRPGDHKHRGRPALFAVAAMLAGCQPLPHPFADDRPPADLLTVRDSAGVSVAPIAGEPVAVAAKLGAATAQALLERDIPASDKTTSLGSYLLYGRLVPSLADHGSTTVTAYWRLYDAEGHMVGERNSKIEAKTGDWEAGDAKPIGQLAAASAAGIAPLLADEAPAETAKAAATGAPSGAGRVRVAVRGINGAPGDGAKSLAAAVATVLRQQDLAIVESGQKPDLTIDGEVSLAPVKPDKQHVKIVWRVLRADGVEIGTVGLENDVPRGLLEGPWGDLAYSVAMAAGEGLLQLVARGAPQPKS
jgi:hypothetical protein